jgi:endonuclease/exonuclease/phosphatase family metal-dependent hydrolase
MDRNDHRRAGRIASGNLGLIRKMVCNRNRFRQLLGQLVIVGIMIFLKTAFGAAQHYGTSKEPLLESGRGEKLSSPNAAKEVKIVSYNIRWRSGTELQQIVHWLKSSQAPAPSIIGLQEVDRAKKRTGNENHAKVLADNLGMYYAWAAPDAPKKSNSKEKEEETGVEILSFYPLEEVTRLVLTTEGPGGRSRVAVGATIRMGSTCVRVYSVHGETRLAKAKKIDQLRMVLDDLAKYPRTIPAIVLGDFNSWEGKTIANVRKLFTEAGFTTPLPDDESTFKRKILGFNIKLKLDWIWVRGMTPQAYGIDRQLTVSDHFPLWTVVKLQEN